MELNVPEYDAALSFYDRIFGWLEYSSFGTLGIAGCTGTHYGAFPHSYFGIQPANGDARLRHELRYTGINHVALWAHSRTEVHAFYRAFLIPELLVVLDPPDYCAEYSPDYYAVFFLDPYGIRWELAHVPLAPSPFAVVKWWRLLSTIGKAHPDWQRHPSFESLRQLPGRPKIKKAGFSLLWSRSLASLCRAALSASLLRGRRETLRRFTKRGDIGLTVRPRISHVGGWRSSQCRTGTKRVGQSLLKSKQGAVASRHDRYGVL